MRALNRAPFRTLAAAFIVLAGVAGTWGAETVFARSADDWLADAFELAQLTGPALLLGLGLLTSIVVLARLVGYADGSTVRARPNVNASRTPR
jgi:hypothetical protein